VIVGSFYSLDPKGFVARYDGSKWSQLDFPINADLYSISMLSAEEGWIVGGRYGRHVLRRLTNGTVAPTIVGRGLALTPYQGPPGQRVTVEGTGFASHSLINISWGEPEQVGPGGLVPVWTDERGEFSTAIYVPYDAATGIHKVVASTHYISSTGQWSYEKLAEAVFTVTSGAPYQIVTPEEIIHVRLPGSYGEPGPEPDGQYTIRARIGTAQGPASGVPVKFRVTRSPGGTYVSPTSATSDLDGYASTTVYLSVAGDSIITIEAGSGSNKATATVTLRAFKQEPPPSLPPGYIPGPIEGLPTGPEAPPDIALNPDYGMPGSEIEVTLTGFQVGQLVDLFLDEVRLKSLYGVSLTIKTTLTIPWDTPVGEHTIMALARPDPVNPEVEQYAAAPLWVGPPRRVDLLCDELVALRQEIELEGARFRPQEEVAIYLQVAGGTRFSLGSATADDSGSFSTSVAIPGHAPPGEASLVAAGSQGSMAAVTITIEAAAQPAESVDDIPDVAGLQMRIDNWVSRVKAAQANRDALVAQLNTANEDLDTLTQAFKADIEERYGARVYELYGRIKEAVDAFWAAIEPQLAAIKENTEKFKQAVSEWFFDLHRRYLSRLEEAAVGIYQIGYRLGWGQSQEEIKDYLSHLTPEEAEQAWKALTEDPEWGQAIEEFNYNWKAMSAEIEQLASNPASHPVTAPCWSALCDSLEQVRDQAEQLFSEFGGISDWAQPWALEMVEWGLSEFARRFGPWADNFYGDLVPQGQELTIELDSIAISGESLKEALADREEPEAQQAYQIIERWLEWSRAQARSVSGLVNQISHRYMGMRSQFIYPGEGLNNATAPAGLLTELGVEPSAKALEVIRSETERTVPPDVRLFGPVLGALETLVANPPQDGKPFQSMDIVLHSPGVLLVTDAQGRRVGTLPDLSSSVNEIPGAFYSGLAAEASHIRIPNPEGQYTVEVASISAGSYSISQSFVYEGTAVAGATEIGVALPGVVQATTVSGSVPLAPVSGRIDLQGRGDKSGATVVVSGLATATDAAGSFSLDVPSGVYHAVTVSMPGYLPAMMVVKGQATTLPDVVLLGGDSNGDGKIDILDLAAVAASFNTSPVSLGPPDINDDGVVDIFDLVLVGLNFGRTESPWPNSKGGLAS